MQSATKYSRVSLPYTDAAGGTGLRNRSKLVVIYEQEKATRCIFKRSRRKRDDGYSNNMGLNTAGVLDPCHFLPSSPPRRAFPARRQCQRNNLEKCPRHEGAARRARTGTLLKEAAHAGVKL